MWPFRKSSFVVLVFVLGLSNWTYVLNESKLSQIETTENHGGWTYETFAKAMTDFFSFPELLINTTEYHTYSN